jgi:hypothetical protein
MNNLPDSLQKKILAKIEAKDLLPRPAYYFLAKRSVFWALAVFSVVLGAINFAVVEFVVVDYFATKWRILDNIHYNELLFGIPLAWLLMAAFFALSASYGMRNTRRGYRVKPSHWTIAAIVTSFILGTMLHASRAGQLAHDFLATRFESYRASTYVPFEEWSRPDQGQLGGTVDAELGNNKIRIKDFKGKLWIVDFTAAEVKLDNPIMEEGDVAITGERTGPDSFRARLVVEFD